MTTDVRPLSLLCELTYRCNLQCPYCYNPLDLDGYRDEIDTATWQRVIGEAADMGIVQCYENFTGGVLMSLVEHDLAAGKTGDLLIADQRWAVLQAVRNTGIKGKHKRK